MSDQDTVVLSDHLIVQQEATHDLYATYEGDTLVGLTEQQQYSSLISGTIGFGTIVCPDWIIPLL